MIIQNSKTSVQILFDDDDTNTHEHFVIPQKELLQILIAHRENMEKSGSWVCLPRENVPNKEPQSDQSPDH